MKMHVFLLAVLLGACASVPVNGPAITLHGIVVNEAGKRIAQAPVVLYEELSRQATIYPKSDKKITEVKTNEKGEFAVSTTYTESLKQLKLVAESKKRTVEVAPSSFKVIFDDGTIRSPSETTINKIVVPNTFVPAR